MSKSRQLASSDRDTLKSFLSSMYNSNQLQVMLATYTDGKSVPDRSLDEVAMRVDVIRELLGAQSSTNPAAASATKKSTPKR